MKTKSNVLRRNTVKKEPNIFYLSFPFLTLEDLVYYEVSLRVSTERVTYFANAFKHSEYLRVGIDLV